jgi:hypothetical protein
LLYDACTIQPEIGFQLHRGHADATIACWAGHKHAVPQLATIVACLLIPVTGQQRLLRCRCGNRLYVALRKFCGQPQHDGMVTVGSGDYWGGIWCWIETVDSAGFAQFRRGKLALAAGKMVGNIARDRGRGLRPVADKIFLMPTGLWWAFWNLRALLPPA